MQVKTSYRQAGAIAVAVVLAALTLFSVATAQRRRGDYLSNELRKQVEALKKDAKREKTSLANLKERKKVMFDWINAFSLTGRPAPVNAPLFMRSAAEPIQGTDQDRERYTRGGGLASMDDVIAEYSLKDDQPGAVGEFTMKSDGTYKARSWATFEQTFTVGALPLKDGGAFILAREQIGDHGEQQVSDPAADNYVSAHSSNPRVKLEPTGIPLFGMHGGFRGAVPMPAYRVTGGDLKKGETVTFVFGDRSGGSRGLLIQTFQSEEVLHPIYVDLDGSGLFLTAKWDTYRVRGTHVVNVRGIAPSVVKTAEPFDLSVRSEDLWYNRSTEGVPAYEISLDGSKVGSLPAGADGLSFVRNLSLDRPGTYRFEIKSADGRITALSNPVWVQDDPSQRLYWGETHIHTGYAEGQGSVDGLYQYARDDAQLDFVGFSEHDIWLDDAEWETMRAAVKRYSEPGKFVSFLSYEWTQSRYSGGHHNVFFRRPDGDRVAAQDYPFLTRLYAGLRSLYDTDDVLIVPHAHQAGDWRLNDPEMERLVEIQSTHGTFEWFGNYYLRNGHQVGFLAASDNHRAQPGYSGTRNHENRTQFGGLAAVWAPEKTNDAVFDNLRARHAYATAPADRIIVDFNVNETPMGERLRPTDTRRLTAKAMGTAPITEVAIIKNGDVVYSKRPAAAPLKSKSFVEVSFDSSTEPVIRDNPRGNRPWKGSLTVKGASLVSARPTNFLNIHFEKAEVDTANPNRVNFYMVTRGRADKILLELDGASRSTGITVELEKTTEMGGAPPMLRPSADLPKLTVNLPFSDLKDGRSFQQWPVDQAWDRIAVEVINPNASMDFDLDYSDTGKHRDGDYYYVRVSQLNGAQAWSSPIWVGGEAPR